MTGEMLLPPNQAQFCRLGGAVFLLAALVMPLVILTAGLTPGAQPYCDTELNCMWRAQPSLLLEEETRLAVAATPAGQHRFEAHAARRDVRLGLAGIDAIGSVPFGLMMLCVGVALRRLGGRAKEALPRALWWLRRASIAAIVCALVQPVQETLLGTWLSAGTPAGFAVTSTIYLANIAESLLLAFAAFATVWALEVTLRARRDLDEFV
jgi:hypothetical protein